MLQSNNEITEATVARIDERTKSIQTELVQIRIDLKETIESVVDRVRDLDKRHGEKIHDIVTRHDELTKTINDDYVKKTDFDLIQKIVYGFVGIIVIAVIGALLSQVVITPKEHSPTVMQQIQKDLPR